LIKETKLQNEKTITRSVLRKKAGKIKKVFVFHSKLNFFTRSPQPNFSFFVQTRLSSKTAFDATEETKRMWRI